MVEPGTELDAIVDRAVKAYMLRMDAVVARIADIVGAELARAKARIAAGQKEVTQRVAGLPRDLKQIGNELLAGFDDKFKALSGDVDARRDAIVEGVAQKYAAARDAANARAGSVTVSPGMNPIVNVLIVVPRRATRRRVACASASSPWASVSSCRPASVNRVPARPRSNSRAPRSRSSERI